MEDEEGADEQQQFSYQQRLKAAVHYTVGCLCQEVASDKEVPLSKQTIAAIAEVTFRQCGMEPRPSCICADAPKKILPKTLKCLQDTRKEAQLTRKM